MFWNNRFEKMIIPRRAQQSHFIVLSKRYELFQKVLR